MKKVLRALVVAGVVLVASACSNNEPAKVAFKADPIYPPVGVSKPFKSYEVDMGDQIITACWWCHYFGL